MGVHDQGSVAFPRERMQDKGGDWEQLTKARDRVEQTERQLARYVEAYRTPEFAGTAPTFDDLGLLWDYLVGIENCATSVLDDVARMRDQMHDVAEMRRELPRVAS